jgi:two-component system invasion response regulator UvrY
MNAENIFAKRFLKAGAKGFVAKDSDLDEITKAIDLALNNKRYISPKLQNLLADELAAIENTTNPFDKLLPKEFEITSLFISGENVAGISKILNINTSTVGHYKNKIFEKLGISSLLELQALYNSYHKIE